MPRDTQTRNSVNGRCPAGWREKVLSSVAELRVSNVDKKTESGERPVRLCNYIDVYNRDYITADMDFMRATATKAEIERFRLARGDVIITKDSETPDEIGVPAVVDSADHDLVCGYHLAVLRPNQDEIDPTFFARQLAQPRIARYFGQQANGSTRYGLSLASIDQTPIWLPVLPTQQAIARVIRLLDAAIEKTEAVIAKLKLVRAGLLHDLLTRGIDHNGELRDPAAHPEQFKDSALGRIPNEWHGGIVDDLVTPSRPIAYGILMPGKAYRGGVPVIKVKDIRDGRIHVSDLLYTDPKIDAAYARSRLVPNDLLFTIRGSVGRMAIVPEHLDGANITQDTARISLNTSNPIFIARWLEMEIPGRFVAVHTLGVAVQGINLRDVRRIPIALVQREEQDQVARMIEQAEAAIDCQRQYLGKLKFVKSGLTTDLLTGRVRVPAALDTGGV